MSRIRSNRVCFTVNNYEDKDCTAFIEYVEKNSKVRYAVCGEEIGEQGTPHLQGMITFKHQRPMGAVRDLFLNRAHLTLCKFPFKAMEYCHKGGLFWQKGTPPQDPSAQAAHGAEGASHGAKGASGGAAGGRAEQQRWQTALTEARATGEVSNAQIAFQHARTIDYIYGRELSKTRFARNEEWDNWWYFGASGTGKSYTARNKYPNAYLKMCNKWWDGYSNEETVLIEDFDKVHHVLCHHLKIWADSYEFLAESKGSARKLRPRRIIVTSNYSPQEIWESASDLEPILRRFNLKEFKLLEGQAFVPPPAEGPAQGTRKINAPFRPPRLMVDVTPNQASNKNSDTEDPWPESQAEVTWTSTETETENDTW